METKATQAMYITMAASARFAMRLVRWDNKFMTQLITKLLGTTTFMAFTMVTAQTAAAQQTPAPAPATQAPSAATPAKPAPGAKTATGAQSSTAAKPGQS